jgi:hypothetical protein
MASMWAANAPWYSTSLASCHQAEKTPQPARRGSWIVKASPRTSPRAHSGAGVAEAAYTTEGAGPGSVSYPGEGSLVSP